MSPYALSITYKGPLVDIQHYGRIALLFDLRNARQKADIDRLPESVSAHFICQPTSWDQYLRISSTSHAMAH